MSQVLYGDFCIEKSGDYAVDLRGGPDLKGTVVAIRIETSDPGLVVIGAQSGNIGMLLPPDGVPVHIFNTMPVKLPASVANRVAVSLRARVPEKGSMLFPVRGRVFAVLQPDDETKGPPEYALGLTLRPKP